MVQYFTYSLIYIISFLLLTLGFELIKMSWKRYEHVLWPSSVTELFCIWGKGHLENYETFPILYFIDNGPVKCPIIMLLASLKWKMYPLEGQWRNFKKMNQKSTTASWEVKSHQAAQLSTFCPRSVPWPWTLLLCAHLLSRAPRLTYSISGSQERYSNYLS